VRAKAPLPQYYFRFFEFDGLSANRFENADIQTCISLFGLAPNNSFALQHFACAQAN